MGNVIFHYIGWAFYYAETGKVGNTYFQTKSLKWPWRWIKIISIGRLIVLCTWTCYLIQVCMDDGTIEYWLDCLFLSYYV